LNNLGSIYYSLGKAEQALEFYGQSLEIRHEIGDKRGVGTALFNIALVLDDLGEPAQAIASAQAALQIFEQIESPNVEKVRRWLGEWLSTDSTADKRTEADG